MSVGERQPRLVDFCSGAGLMSEGFRRAGFEPIFAMEMDKAAAASYAKNVGRHVELGDVTRNRPAINAEVLIAGPPCQGFSTLGKRDDSDPRNRISLAISEWASAIRPKVIVVENVPRFLQSKIYGLLKRRLARAGYVVTEWLLDASKYGVPQRRTRAFAVFYLGDGIQEPNPQHGERAITDAFENLPNTEPNPAMGYAPRPGALALARFKKLPPGGDKRDLVRLAPHLCPPSWLKMGAQATDVWGRIHPDRPANTLRCCFQNPSKGRYVHPTEDRVITLREGARIQGVLDAWGFEGRPYPVARQIGNGVPIPLAEAVARSVRELIS